jgi:PST family polysaccharide transporter
MRFVALAAIEVVGLLVGVATAIVAAWRGAGYWSLVFMQLAMAGTIAGENRYRKKCYN